MDNRSCSGYSDCYVANSTSNSILAEQLNFSENFKCFELNDSFTFNPRDSSNNSFSYTPLKPNLRNSLGKSSLYSSHEISINLENIDYVYVDENENMVLIEAEDIKKQTKSVEKNKDKNLQVFKTDCHLNENENLKIEKQILSESEQQEKTNKRDSLDINEDKNTNCSIGNKIDHNLLKLFKCSYAGCTKAYKSKENMILHVKNIHLKEKPYSCKYCKVSFSHRNGKTYHERKFHTNYLPHKCKHEDCDVGFASKSALNYHIKSQHSPNPNRKANRINKSKFNEKIMQLVSLPF